jgi:hypothetical protein
VAGGGTRWKVLLGLAATGVALMIGGAAAQQQPAAGAGRGNFSNNFTGKITVGDSTNMRTSRIRFEAGARTNWHRSASVHEAEREALARGGARCSRASVQRVQWDARLAGARDGRILPGE